MNLRAMAREATATSVVGLAARLAPLASTAVVAAAFGVGAPLDAWFLALVGPVMLAGILGMAVATAYVPVLVRARDEDPDAWPDVAGALLAWTATAGLGLAAAWTVAAPAVLSPWATRIPTAPDATPAHLARLLAPLVVLVPLRGALVAAWQAHRRFRLPAAVSACVPLATIVAVFTLAGRIGTRALPVGVVGGEVVACAMLVGGMPRAGIALPRPAWRAGRRLRGALALAAPQVVSGVALRLNPVVDRTMAALLGTGSITALAWGERLQSIPQQLLATGLLGVLLSHWSTAGIRGRHEELRENLRRVHRALFLAMLAVTAAAIPLRRPLVAVVMARGAFGADDVDRVAGPFAAYCLQIAPMVGTLLFARAFVALEDTRTLMRAGLANCVLNAAFNGLFAFALGLGAVGIALSTISVTWVLWAALAVALSRRLGGDVTGLRPRARTVDAPMRVTITIKRFVPGEFVGGAEAFAARLASALRARGVEVTVVAARMRREWAPLEILGDGVRVERLPHPRVRGFGTAVYAAALLARLARDPGDVVFGSLVGPDTVAARVATWLRRRAVVWKVASSGVRGDLELLRRAWHAPLTLRALRGVDAWIALNAEVERDLAAAGIDPGRARRIPNGVDPRRFEPVDAAARRAARRDLGLDTDAVLILSAGRLTHQKGFDVLVEALARLPRHAPWRAAILGRGRMRAALEGRAQALGIADRITILPVADVRPWLRAADVFVLPSRWEGLSNALLEAQASGLACVVSDAPGNPDVVRDGESGLCVPREDVRALAEAIARLVADAGLRERLGRAARHRVLECFDIARVVDAYLACFEELAPRRACASWWT